MAESGPGPRCELLRSVSAEGPGDLPPMRWPQRPGNPPAGPGPLDASRRTLNPTSLPSRSRPDPPHRPQRPAPRLPPVPPRRVSRRARVGPDRPRPRARCPGAADPAGRPGPRPPGDDPGPAVRGRARARSSATWFEQGGIPPRTSTASVHFAAVTRCYPGRLPGAKGDRVPSPRSRPSAAPGSTSWSPRPPARGRPAGRPAGDPDLPRAASSRLTAVVGTATIRDGVLYLPFPHPSGVSRWLNEPANVAAVGRAMDTLRSSIKAGEIPDLGETQIEHPRSVP